MSARTAVVCLAVIAAMTVMTVMTACREPAAPASPPVPHVPPGPVALVVADAGVGAPPAAPEPAEEGVLYSGGESVARGDTTIAGGRAIFRDAKEQLRARSLDPRETHGTEQRPIRIALGDRVIYGPWDVRWIGVREGLVRLEGRRRGASTGEWSASSDDRLATHDLETPHRLFAFQVRLVATFGRLDHSDGAIEITARESDLTTPARYGQALPQGLYVFPDGLRMHIGQGDGCDFDVSDPCPFGTWYGASASLGDQEVGTAVRKRQVKLLGRTLEVVARGTFIVRK